MKERSKLKNPIMERLRGKITTEDKAAIDRWFDELDNKPIDCPTPPVEVKTTEEILMSHYSGIVINGNITMSIEEIAEVMEAYHAQFTTSD